MNIFISDAVQAAIADTAQAVQEHLEREQGAHYCVAELQSALVKWLELSIESLADDAFYHCIEGDRAYAFNRSAFTSALAKLTPAHEPAAVDELVA